MVSYYQQVGRAGRAVGEAYGVLLHGDEDAGTHEHFAECAFPSQDDIDDILAALSQSYLGFTEEELEQRCNIRPKHIAQVNLHTCMHLQPESQATFILRCLWFLLTDLPCMPHDVVCLLSVAMACATSRLSMC